ncbi:conserved protein of unknown function (plasmid) [Cupriavidus taiwanensis]|uniref:ParB-like nuclease n=2 Tax=Cupriavidus taiwanensis TaxID=164546 RepID=A0A375IRB3_9BURK|nr:conserved hypothetical protein [Cupriavidus taiwanensis]SOZ73448.1 conserved hypothetical protein [Cupriavidus taiwanensis]SOZ83336.1 conserved hypothetical protein [Cupriavidus taiwanensis]SOZ85886.1 conserved hypothetical protein [Cupriavidus taiwanensis]SOZ92721.1 conserved hypothetical protein [Cupriavidus taiwanensis]
MPSAQPPAHTAPAQRRAPRKLAPDSKLMVPLDALRPTQITVGGYHVAQKIHVTRRVAPEARAAFLDRHRVHLVIAPEQLLYVVDHHHWVRAWHDLGLTHVPGIVRADLSDMDVPAFWRHMVANHLVHPYDEHGRRQPLSELPEAIHDMRDDPYRSLEAFVQLAGGYRKVKTAYPDFRWADFFRRHVPGPFDTPHHFAFAVANAFRLAHSREARDLPGYIGALGC